MKSKRAKHIFSPQSKKIRWKSSISKSKKINRDSEPSTKSMVIRVTDDRLIEKSGGIIQGMSGSPVVQNGKLVGAVTHVFVNDPTRGYGIFASTMIEQSENGKKS